MKKQRSPFLKNETQRYAAVGILFGLLFPGIATIVRIANSGLPLGFSSIAMVQATDSLLWIINTAPLFLGLFAALAGRRQDRLINTYEELKQRERELENVQHALGQRVEERTRELLIANQQMTKRAEQLKLVADVAKSAIAIQDVDRLLPNIAELIHQRFNIYHVGVFLLDEQKQYAILRASNSDGGLIMLKQGHRLKIGAQGIVGFVVSRGEPRIALDVGQDTVFFDNPDLPDTRSEMALPLKIGDMIIGALDLQSTEEKAFSEEDVSVLSILSDQVAIAIQNARSSELVQRALYEAIIRKNLGRLRKKTPNQRLPL
jgi:transcriptional regulator with GAF, ATPase, and Fis domain